MPLLPFAPFERARVRALARKVACDIHPLNNLWVLRYLVRTLDIGDEAKNDWCRHWIHEELSAFEARLVRDPVAGRFCHGDTATFADCFLVPQVYNAQRFVVNLDL